MLKWVRDMILIKHEFPILERDTGKLATTWEAVFADEGVAN